MSKNNIEYQTDRILEKVNDSTQNEYVIETTSDKITGTTKKDNT